MKRIKNYETVEDWSHLAGFNLIFGNVKLFESIGWTGSDLYDYFMAYYSERYIAIPIDLTDPDSYNSAEARLISVITMFTNANDYKYKTLLRSITQEYDPIENYNMTENSNDNLKHKPDGLTDTVTSSGTDTTSGKTTNKVSPYDTNATTTAGEADSSGSSTSSVTSETIIRNGYSDTDTHSLTRKGNIGVTTSQQMLQSERDIAMFSIIEEYFRELNKNILISLW